MYARTLWLLPLGLLLAFTLLECKTSDDSGTPVSNPVTCDSCKNSQCTSAAAACAADPSCAKIDACVNATSPCVGARANDPLCKDDCYKQRCAALTPAGISLYKALSTCQNTAECAQCSNACVAFVMNMDCVADDTCDIADQQMTQTCGCTKEQDAGNDASDGSTDDADDADDDATAEDAQDDAPPVCVTKASCAVVGDGDIDSALGIDVLPVDATTRTTGNITVDVCNFKADPQGSDHLDNAAVRYQYPDDLAGFMVGREGFSGTSDVSTFNPLPAYTYSDSGITTLVVLDGCVEIQVTSSTDLGGLESLMSQIIGRL